MARAKPMQDVTRSMRIKFVTGMTRSLLDKPYPPQFIMFAKGATGDHHIRRIRLRLAKSIGQISQRPLRPRRSACNEHDILVRHGTAALAVGWEGLAGCVQCVSITKLPVGASRDISGEASCRPYEKSCLCRPAS